MKVYVSVAHQRYYFSPYVSPWEFSVDIEPRYLRLFDQLFSQLQTLEGKNLWRAQLPAIPYHLDKENDEIDLRLKKLYALIHEFGDKDTKVFIERMPYYS